MRIRIRLGENEIELDGSEAFVKRQLEQFYARLGGASTGARTALKDQLLSQTTPSKSSGKVPTPAEFYKARGKTDGVSRILVFGKYLEHFRSKPEFTRKDINAVAKEAKLSRDIHAQFFTNAVKQGLLRKQGEKYSLTLSAEELLAGN